LGVTTRRREKERLLDLQKKKISVLAGRKGREYATQILLFLSKKDHSRFLRVRRRGRGKEVDHVSGRRGRGERQLLSSDGFTPEVKNTVRGGVEKRELLAIF